MFPLIVGNYIGGKPAKRTDLQERRGTRKMAQRVVDQIQVAAVEHSSVRIAKPFHIVVGDVDLGRRGINDEAAFRRARASKFFISDRRSGIPPALD